MKDTDWRKKLEQSKGQSCDKSWKFLVDDGQDEKYRRVIIDIIPCVVVTSLETDAIVAFIAFFDMLIVRSNLSARSKIWYSRSVATLKEKKRPRFCISRLRSNEFYSTESWRIGIERFGGTHLKFSGGTWYKIELGKEKGNLEALSKKVNPMSEIPARPVLRNEHLRNLMASRLWQQSSLTFGEKMQNAEPERMKAQIKTDTSRRRSRKPDNGTEHEFLFTISICSQQCDYSMKRQRFYCLTYFAQKHGYPCEGKIGETLRLANNGKSITCTMDNFVLPVVPGLSSFPAAVCLQQSRSTDQKNYFRKLGLLSDPFTTRSDKHACGKQMLTDADKQATGNRELACEIFQKMYQEDPTQGIPDWLQPFTENLEDLEYMCSHILLKEWIQIRTATLQKWRHKSGSTVFILTSTKYRKRCIPRTEEIGDMKTVEHKSESRNNHHRGTRSHCSPDIIRVKPKLDRRRTRICESQKSRHRSQKLFIWTINENLANIVKSYHGIIGQLYLIDQRQEIAERAVRRVKKGHQPFYCNLD